MAFPLRSARRRQQLASADDPALRAEIDTVRRVLANYPPGTRLLIGAPTRCPRCADFGLVEGVDMRIGSSANRCLSCGTTWTITGRALRAVHELRRSPARSVDLPPVPETIRLSAPTSVARRIVAATDDERAASTHVAPRSTPMRVLLVEDDPADIEVVRAILEPYGDDVIDLRCATSRSAGEAAARESTPDLVLLDLGLPDSHGMQTVTKWHFSSVHAPVLVVSGQYGREVADRGRELGVTDFMDKSELAELLADGAEGSARFVERLEAALAS